LKHGHARVGQHSPEYRTWRGMVKRCHSKNDMRYPDYGGRGVVVCTRWRNNFEAFLSDVGKKPATSFSIDRINNEKGYSPANCRWASRTEQARNKRSNRRLRFNGETLTAVEWAERLGFNYWTLVDRLDEGWSVKAALTTPVRQQRRQTCLSVKTQQR
jgi:hypothetical protein